MKCASPHLVSSKQSDDPQSSSEVNDESNGKEDARRKSEEADEWRPNWSRGGQFTPSAHCVSFVSVFAASFARRCRRAEARAFVRQAPRRRVGSSSILIGNSRDAGILIIQLRCHFLCRAPGALAGPVHSPARRVGAPILMATAAELRIRVASTWPGMARRTPAASAAASSRKGACAQFR
jgi:hypothetical protein